MMYTGFKTKYPDSFVNKTTERLEGLPAHNWWAGVNVFSVGDSSEFFVRIRCGDGSPVFGAAYDSWLQQGNTWKSFPWPIPGAMASALDICVDIRRISSSDQRDYIFGVKTCFYELRRMKEEDRYLFFDVEGGVVSHWNGPNRLYGTQKDGPEPEWKKLHRVIPPFESIGAWEENEVFCIHEWTDRLE